LTKPVIVLV
jgi:hypothetical protein